MLQTWCKMCDTLSDAGNAPALKVTVHVERLLLYYVASFFCLSVKAQQRSGVNVYGRSDEVPLFVRAEHWLATVQIPALTHTLRWVGHGRADARD